MKIFNFQIERGKQKKLKITDQKEQGKAKCKLTKTKTQNKRDNRKQIVTQWILIQILQ